MMDSLLRKAKNGELWARAPVLTPAPSQANHSSRRRRFRTGQTPEKVALSLDSWLRVSQQQRWNNQQKIRCLLLSGGPGLVVRKGDTSVGKTHGRRETTEGDVEMWYRWHFGRELNAVQRRTPGAARSFSGHAILQLLQNTNDLAALRCVSAQMAELARSEPQDGQVDACLNFHHFDIQSRRGDINHPSRGSWLLLPFVRVCLKFSPR